MFGLHKRPNRNQTSASKKDFYVRRKVLWELCHTPNYHFRELVYSSRLFLCCCFPNVAKRTQCHGHRCSQLCVPI